jgi:hypothetical protein
MATSLGADVFGYKRNPKPQGVFSTENSKLVFGTIDPSKAIGWLVQNWNVSYNQDVQELFEIGSNNLYWAKGRPQGTGGLSRIIGSPDKAAGGNGSFFPKEAYDICDGGATLTIAARGGSCDFKGTNVDEQLNQEVKVTLSGVVVTGIGFSMNVGDVKLVEQFGFRFGYMKLG